MSEYKFDTALVTQNVSDQYKKLSKIIRNTPQVALNLSGITNIDSSGLALLLELKSLAKQKSCTLVFMNTNDIIERLCQLYKITL